MMKYKVSGALKGEVDIYLHQTGSLYRIDYSAKIKWGFIKKKYKDSIEVPYSLLAEASINVCKDITYRGGVLKYDSRKGKLVCYKLDHDGVKADVWFGVDGSDPVEIVKIDAKTSLGKIKIHRG
jgi:hypothetical protein